MSIKKRKPDPAKYGGVEYCDFCGGKTKAEVVNTRYYRFGRWHRVKDVDAEVCQSCGEMYFNKKTLDEIDARLQPKRAVA